MSPLFKERSRGPAATTPGLHPGNDGSSPSGTTDSIEGVLHNTSSRSSPECSPPCHGGDRGFKSRRGRSTTRHGTQTGKAAKLKSSRLLWVRLPPVSHIGNGPCSPRRPVTPSSSNKRSGRREVRILHDPLKTRSSIGRTPAPPAGRTTLTGGARFKSRAGHWQTKNLQRGFGRQSDQSAIRGQVVQLVDTRRSERRALPGLGVRLSPWSLVCGLTCFTNECVHDGGGR